MRRVVLAGDPDPSREVAVGGLQIPARGRVAREVAAHPQGTFEHRSRVRPQREVVGCDPTTPCYANCDQSTNPPILNVDDFTCFINEFAAAQVLPPAAQITHYANCDGSTTTPVLNVDDFTCFINEFAAAQGLPHQQQVEHYANCDGSTTAPVLNVDDFTCFINEFAAGCD